MVDVSLALFTIPKGMAPGSDVANLSLLGYDPEEHYTGRAPLEAASLGVEGWYEWWCRGVVRQYCVCLPGWWS